MYLPCHAHVARALARPAMAQTPVVLPLLDAAWEDRELLRADALDVWRELGNLAKQAYNDWKLSCHERALAEHPKPPDDHYNWNEALVQARYMEIYSQERDTKAEELNNRMQDSFTWWWSQESARLEAGQRVKRLGETMRPPSTHTQPLAVGWFTLHKPQ